MTGDSHEAASLWKHVDTSTVSALLFTTTCAFFPSITSNINTKSRSDFIKAVGRLLLTSSKLVAQKQHSETLLREWLWSSVAGSAEVRIQASAEVSVLPHVSFPSESAFQLFFFLLLKNYALSVTTNTVRHSSQWAWKQLFTASCTQSSGGPDKSRDLFVIEKVAQSWIPDV